MNRLWKRFRRKRGVDPHVPFVNVGAGLSPAPWRVRLHSEDVRHYEGHAYITSDPKGLGRSVCDGHIDDMAWIADARNKASQVTGEALSDIDGTSE